MPLTVDCCPTAKWLTDANTKASSNGAALESLEGLASAFSVHSRSWSSHPLAQHANIFSAANLIELFLGSIIPFN